MKTSMKAAKEYRRLPTSCTRRSSETGTSTRKAKLSTTGFRTPVHTARRQVAKSSPVRRMLLNPTGLCERMWPHESAREVLRDTLRETLCSRLRCCPCSPHQRSSASGDHGCTCQAESENAPIDPRRLWITTLVTLENMVLEPSADVAMKCGAKDQQNVFVLRVKVKSPRKIAETAYNVDFESRQHTEQLRRARM